MLNSINANKKQVFFLFFFKIPRFLRKGRISLWACSAFMAMIIFPYSAMAQSSGYDLHGVAGPSLSVARRQVVDTLLAQLGKAYRWGGDSPHTGFDCSGLVNYAYRGHTNAVLPRTADGLFHMRESRVVSDKTLKPGDLVFFSMEGKHVDHVGVFLGNGNFIEAPHTGENVKIARLDNERYRRHYRGAKRLHLIATGPSANTLIQTAAATTAADTGASAGAAAADVAMGNVSTSLIIGGVVALVAVTAVALSSGGGGGGANTAGNVTTSTHP